MSTPNNENAPTTGMVRGAEGAGFDGLPSKSTTIGSPLRLFEFETTTPIRVVVLDGEPWFVGKDVAELLGYSDTVNGIKQHCRGVVKHHPIVDALGRRQDARIIGEPDLWRLVAKSQLPEAQRVEAWIFEKVLPAVRRTGGYSVAATVVPENFAAALRLAADQAEQIAHQAAIIEHQQTAVSEAESAVAFVGQVSASWQTHTLKEAATLLHRKGVLETGRNRLADYLRALHWTDAANAPNQKAVEAGYLERKFTGWVHPETGQKHPRTTTLVTGKGLLKLQELLSRRQGAGAGEVVP